jgi:hypothetical protein
VVERATLAPGVQVQVRRICSRLRTQRWPIPFGKAIIARERPRKSRKGGLKLIDYVGWKGPDWTAKQTATHLTPLLHVTASAAARAYRSFTASGEDRAGSDRT